MGKARTEKTPAKPTPTKPTLAAKPPGKGALDQQGARSGQRTFESHTPQSAAMAPEPVAKPQSAAARRANTGAGTQGQGPTTQSTTSKSTTTQSTLTSALAGQQAQPTRPSATPVPPTKAEATPKTAAKTTAAPSRTTTPVDQPQNLELFPLDSEEVTTGASKDKTPKSRKLQVAVSVPKTKRA